MAAPVVSANYQELQKIAQQFATQQKQIQGLTQSLVNTVDQLRQGGWVADAANRYYRNMDQSIFPSLRRLSTALGHSQDAVLEIARIFRQAEEEACAGLRGEGSIGWNPIGTEENGNSDQTSGETQKPKDGDWIGDPYTAKAIVVNGIQNDAGDLGKMMEGVSGAFGGAPVMGVYNATEGKFDLFNPFSYMGIVRDVGQAVADKFEAHIGFRIGPENPAVKSLADAIIASDGHAPIIAHSQGGAITAAALTELSHRGFDLNKLTVVTMGTAEISFPDGPHYTHYVHAYDMVPALGEIYHFDPVTLTKVVLKGEVKITAIPSISPFDNHDFNDNGIGSYINDLKQYAEEQMIGGL